MITKLASSSLAALRRSSRKAPNSQFPRHHRVATMKLVYAASAVVLAALAGSAYFFRNSLLSNSSPITPQVAKLNLPTGAIFIPAGDGICRMHALDNKTGQVMDYGVVKCSDASTDNLDRWSRAMNQDKFIEIGKSFRHDADQPSK
jgi:hypothetical protein